MFRGWQDLLESQPLLEPNRAVLGLESLSSRSNREKEQCECHKRTPAALPCSSFAKVTQLEEKIQGENRLHHEMMRPEIPAVISVVLFLSQAASLL